MGIVFYLRILQLDRIRRTLSMRLTFIESAMLKPAIILFALLSMGMATGQVSKIKLPELEQMVSASESPMTVVNFWATWCGPCIEEMPHFLEASKMPDVALILVSLDFPEEEAKVNKFVKRRDIDHPVFLLDEKDYDSYMPKINSSWTGAIPATLVVTQGGSRSFYEQSFTRAELHEMLNKHRP